MVPIGLSLLCLFYYLAFLVHLGEMFYRGSDVVANAAYGMTLFTEVHRAGWTVPKPAEMLLFGAAYGITRDLWAVHLVLILATALTVWAGCRLLTGQGEALAGCIAFSVFLTTLPRIFGATLSGGPGCLNVMFLFLALACMGRKDRPPHRILAVLFLSLANLSRPDSWPCAYLLVLALFAPRLPGGRRSGLNRRDFLFLVPLAMPLVWVLADWAFFGDPLYSTKIARSYAAEAILGRDLPTVPEAAQVLAYFPRLAKALFDLFSLSGWFSIRTGLVGVLCLAGAAAMLRRQPRTLLLVACLPGGTLLFYFVYALRGTLFRIEYVYTVFVSLLLIASAGLDGLCGLARRVRPAPVGRCLQAGLLCAALLTLTLEPYQKRVLAEKIPMFKQRALVSTMAEAAIDSLAEDIRRTGAAPIILTTQWVPGSRIALRLGTGKDIFLTERIVAKERMGRPEALPDFNGRTVYCCFLNQARRDVSEFLRRVMTQAARREVIYDRDGLVVLKCIY
jgi:hypothetical protein